MGVQSRLKKPLTALRALPLARRPGVAAVVIVVVVAVVVVTIVVVIVVVVATVRQRISFPEALNFRRGCELDNADFLAVVGGGKILPVRELIKTRSLEPLRTKNPYMLIPPEREMRISPRFMASMRIPS